MKKYIKYLLGILALCVLIPVKSLAANDDVYIGGQQIVGNSTVTLSSGTASMDYQSRTLTLTNAYLDGFKYFGSYQSNITASGNLTIKLVGNNTIKPMRCEDASTIVQGIHVDGNLVFTGDGSLTIQNVYNGGYGLYASGSVEIKNASLDLTGDVYGLSASSIKISGGSVKSYGSIAAFKSAVTISNSSSYTVKVGSSRNTTSNWNNSTALSSYKYVELAPKAIELYVNGVQLAPGKLNVECGNGSASYDIASNTLTLNNATLVNFKNVTSMGNEANYIYSEVPNLTINLVGTNTISTAISGYDYVYGINQLGSGLTIKGSGKLNIEMSDNAFGISADSVTFSNTNIKIYTKFVGVYAEDGNISFNNTSADIYGGDYGVFSYEKVTVSGDMTRTTVYGGTSSANATKLTGNYDINQNYPYVKIVYTPADTTPKANITKLTNSWYGVTVKWSAVSGYSYALYRKAAGESSYKKITTTEATGYYDKTALNNVKYTYMVRLVKNGTEGKDGGTLTTHYMAPPSISSVTNKAGQVDISWSAVTGAKGYYVYRKDTQAGTWHFIGSALTTSFSDKTVENGVVYYYAIKSFTKDAAGNITSSASSSAKNTLYVKNIYISAISNIKTAKISLTLSSNPKATGYEIEYSKSAGFAAGVLTKKVTTPSALTQTLSSLTKGSTYYVRARAYKTAGGYTFYSPWSAVKTVKISQ